jgi:hypothetical protein
MFLVACSQRGPATPEHDPTVTVVTPKLWQVQPGMRMPSPTWTYESAVRRSFLAAAEPLDGVR